MEGRSCPTTKPKFKQQSTLFNFFAKQIDSTHDGTEIQLEDPDTPMHPHKKAKVLPAVTTLRELYAALNITLSAPSFSTM